MGRVVPFRKRRRWRPARLNVATRLGVARLNVAAWLGVAAVAVYVYPGLVDPGRIEASVPGGAIGLCRTGGSTCVVDGDTIRHRGERIRLLGINTPEIGSPACAREARLGEQAARRLVEILNEGPFDIVAAGGRDEDRYGRKLRDLRRAGRSLGDRLVAEGLAHRWRGYKESWCS